MKSVVPLHVYMTWKHKQLPPLMRQSLITLQQQNPEFQFHLYSDEDCLDFIRKHFSPMVVSAFNALLPGAYKADLWRLCILYVNGGYYMDIKLSSINGFRLIELSDGEHFALDRPQHSLHIYNAIMVCKAKNPFLLKCIRQIVYHVSIQYYGESYLSPTGPEMMGRVAKSFRLPIDMNYPLNYPEHIMYKGRLVLRNYPGYREEQTQLTKTQPYYANAWRVRDIYKKK